MAGQVNQDQTVKLTFEYKSTGMGGYANTIIISFRTGKQVRQHIHKSRTGSHGDITYYLLPAKYLAYQVRRSNLGNTYIRVSVIEVTADGQVKELESWKLYDGKAPATLLSQLPRNILELLLDNRDSLPLFYYLEDQLQQPES